MRLTPVLGGLLAASSAYAHGSHHRRRTPSSGLRERGERVLGRRGVGEGGGCGPSAGNAVCDEGLCCSLDGFCGTGGEFCAAPDCQLDFGPACDAHYTPPGANTADVPRPRFGNVPYGVDITSCTVPGKMALTFDDGPHIYTAELLDKLAAANARATFFIVGRNYGKEPFSTPGSEHFALVQRMFNDGHQIGSHSWSHQDMNELNASQRKDQIVKNEMAIVNTLGFIPTYYRPPYTSCDGDCYNDLGYYGYHVTNYNLDTLDWQNGGDQSRNIYMTALEGANSDTDSFVCLAHDVQPHTVHELADFFISQALEYGYELVPVGECLGDPEGNWYRDPATGEPWDPDSGHEPQEPEPTTEEPPPPPPTSTKPKPTSTKKTSTSTTPKPTSTSSSTPKPSSSVVVPSSTSSEEAVSASESSSAASSATTAAGSTTSTTATADDAAAATSTSTGAAPAGTMAVGNPVFGLLAGAVALGVVF